MASIVLLGLSLLLAGSGVDASKNVVKRLSIELAKEYDTPVYEDDSIYFPLENSTFYLNPNVTHASSASSAPVWVNPFPMPDCYGYNFEEATVDQLQAWMTNGELTSRQIVMCYFSRITQIDEYVNAIMEINSDALTIADALDKERACGTVRGPLHGIPFIVKDNIATKDKMETTAGSFALLGSIVPRDSHVVKLLRGKGAVLLGKATLDEWASERTWSKSSGYSSRGGQARNAYNLSTAPGGSSSGSCQAVTTSMIAIAYGTETDGSVIGPARRAALVGIKPTVGLTSRAGVVPESVHQDTVGSFGRTFKDAVLALEGIVGVDERDNYTLAQIGKVPEDYNYTQFITTKESLKGAVFGLPWASIWNMTSAAPDVPGLLEVIAEIEAAGATIINGTEFPHYKDVLSPDGYSWQPKDYAHSMQYRGDVDFYNNIRDYLSELNNTNIRTIEDIMAFDIQYTGIMGGIPGTVAGFSSGQDGFDNSNKTLGIMNSSYYECNYYLMKTSQWEGIDAALNYTYPNGTNIMLDALLVPSGSGATNLPAQAGYPMITIPVGLNAHSVPFGISLIGTAFSEPSLIHWGSAIDDLWKGRTLPQFYQYWSQLVPVDYSL